MLSIVLTLMLAIVKTCKLMADFGLLSTLYWIVVAAWGIVGLVVFWGILSYRWQQIPPELVSVIQLGMVLHPILPGHTRYMELKFTVLRHAIVFAITAVLICYVKNKFALSMLLQLNFWYAALAFYRYNSRKKYLATLGQASIDAYAIPVSDSFYGVAHAIVCVAVLYVLYGIRPY